MVNIHAILIDEKVLADEIARLSKILSPAEFDGPALRTLVQDLPESQYEYVLEKHYGLHSNTIDWREILEIVSQIVSHAWEDNYGFGAEASANTLYDFTINCVTGFCTHRPLNEYGFESCAIIGPANARRLHTLFSRIDFELLRPVFADHCRKERDGEEYQRVLTLDKLKEYLGFLDTRLAQAVEKNKVLYMWTE